MILQYTLEDMVVCIIMRCHVYEMKRPSCTKSVAWKELLEVR